MNCSNTRYQTRGKVSRFCITRRLTLLAVIVCGLFACSQDNSTADSNASSSSQSADTQSELSPNNTNTLVEINDGQIEGVVQANGSRAWLGIPYAQPPVGELRWKLPQPIESWDGIYDASNNIQPCPQAPSVLVSGIEDSDGDGVVGSEDCLYLSVYAPSSIDSDKPLPVMYWIFGGGNNSGYAGDYDGGFLAEQHDVIVVTVNYRLGFLGWFLHEAILDEGASGAAASGNWATVDTIQGLQWVQNNIAAFGGDPNNVTIFGESAGAGNVLTLLVSPMAKGLFHRAISQSGGAGAIPMSRAINFTDDEQPGVAFSSKEVINKILIRDGKASDRNAAKDLQASMTKNELKDLLYAETPASLMKIYNPNGARNYPAPKKTMDGTVLLKEAPMDSLANGNYHQVPLLFGTNRDERRIYMYRDPKWIETVQNDPAEYIRAAKYDSDAWKLRGVDNIARATVPVQSEPFFAYRYDWDEQATYNGVDLSVAIGAAHATEMALVFGDWDVGFVPKDILYDPQNNPSRDKLSQAMMSYWTNFAYNGNPGKGRNGDLPEWQAWEMGEDKPKMIILDSDSDGGIRMSNDTVTEQSIKAEFLADKFSSQENRCNAYRSTFGRMGEFKAEEYANLGCQ